MFATAFCPFDQEKYPRGLVNKPISGERLTIRFPAHYARIVNSLNRSHLFWLANPRSLISQSLLVSYDSKGSHSDREVHGASCRLNKLLIISKVSKRAAPIANLLSFSGELVFIGESGILAQYRFSPKSLREAN